jgi:hypothetical protein
MLLTFSEPRVWPKSRRVAPPPTLCAPLEWEGLPCRDPLQRELIALGDLRGRFPGRWGKELGQQG